MQRRYVGGIDDFAKFALLRHVMKHRHLAVCWYLTGENEERKDRERYFGYLQHPDDFRHFAPELFDQLAEFDGGSGGVVDPLVELQMTRILGNAVFVRKEVPKRVSLRRLWADELACSVRGANLVFLDPDYGIEGRRLTNRHVALAEIVALRLRDRALIIGHRQSGRRSEAKFLADRMRSLGCDPVEIIRLRLGTSRFYVIADHDSAIAELIATFARKWGNRVKSYQGDTAAPASRSAAVLAAPLGPEKKSTKSSQERLMRDYSYVVVIENPLGHRSAFTIIVKADNSARADEIVDRAKGALRMVVDHANTNSSHG